MFERKYHGKSYIVGDNVKKNKVIIIIGATRTGKFRLSIDLVTRFPIEIINSDKIQVPISERLGLPHHLLGQVEQDVDYSSNDFCRDTIAIIGTILKSNRVPIFVGGSNSFPEAFVEDSAILDSYISKRVDQMVDAGLVDEVREIFDEKANYNRGVRRAIGVPEMHDYFQSEAKLDKARKDALLASSNEKIKENTCGLTRSQVWKILGWRDEIR
ncbi:hypothetical protein M9H77_06605 [Catharanthus roseus]|uniref:Uncharacterized protein n=1 Tax=Catharanthus roseus TaxID=4058 RepID=A0ACC0BSK5_CATRO|nr:hypothetical protein M9H77_06605 [Catharanthus roseus]